MPACVQSLAVSCLQESANRFHYGGLPELRFRYRGARLQERRGKMDQPIINNPSSQGGTPSFEMPPNLTAPEPMGGKSSSASPPPPGGSPPPDNGPLMSPPKKPIFSLIIIIFLIIVLIAGILLFAGWRGWISLGGLFKPKPSPSIIVSPKISPAISAILPTVSPEISSSPQITSNINDETRKKDLTNIKSGLKNYYLAKSEYPKSTAIIKTSDQTSILAQALVPSYLESLPDDPTAPQFYYGYKSDDGQTFELTAVLEDKSDSSGTISGQLNIYKITNSSVE